MEVDGNLQIFVAGPLDSHLLQMGDDDPQDGGKERQHDPNAEENHGGQVRWVMGRDTLTNLRGGGKNRQRHNGTSTRGVGSPSCCPALESSQHLETTDPDFADTSATRGAPVPLCRCCALGVAQVSGTVSEFPNPANSGSYVALLRCLFPLELANGFRHISERGFVVTVILKLVNLKFGVFGRLILRFLNKANRLNL
jgi:hypothetical protein